MTAPAQFDRANQHRKSMLAKVHIAKKTLDLSDDDYQAVLVRVAGRESAGDCNNVELDAVLKEFERKGFSAKARSGGPRPADHRTAKKARALWISLYQLGAFRDPSEQGLEAFARRQLGVAKLQWANQALAYRLIEALKAIAERHGWDQSIEGVQASAVPTVLKRRLVRAQLAKLHAAGLIPADWTVTRAAYDLAGIRIAGMMLASAEELEPVSAAFGETLRTPVRPLSAGDVVS